MTVLPVALSALLSLQTPTPGETDPAAGGETPATGRAIGESTSGSTTESTGLVELLERVRTAAVAEENAAAEALKDYATDLRLEYQGSAEHLEKRFDEIAKGGAPTATALLELLAPANPGDPGDRNLAENAQRILARMDLTEHRAALVDLFETGDAFTRRLMFRLLPKAGGDQITAALARVFPQLDQAEMVQRAFDADRQMGADALAPRARASLQHPDKRIRAAALEHVLAAGDSRALPELRAALRNEKQANLLGLHVRAFLALTERDAESVELFLPLLADNRSGLAAEDRRRLLRGLGRLAPEEHDATADLLTRTIEETPQFEDALAAGLGLRDLGERRADRQVYDRAEKELREDQSGTTFEQLADAYAAFDDVRRAEKAYRTAMDRDGRNPLFRRRIERKLCLIYAAADNTSRFLKALEGAELTRPELRDLADENPALRQMLEKDRVQKMLDELVRRD